MMNDEYFRVVTDAFPAPDPSTTYPWAMAKIMVGMTASQISETN
jgi:hypothetical protein